MYETPFLHISRNNPPIIRLHSVYNLQVESFYSWLPSYARFPYEYKDRKRSPDWRPFRY
jgi:hypothetical protein